MFPNRDRHYLDKIFRKSSTLDITKEVCVAVGTVVPFGWVRSKPIQGWGRIEVEQWCTPTPVTSKVTFRLQTAIVALAVSPSRQDRMQIRREGVEVTRPPPTRDHPRFAGRSTCELSR
jgi:hypothetical protein